MMAYHLGWVDQNGEPEPAVSQDRTHGQIVLASAQAAGSDVAAAMPYAVAIELLNNFMLVHEDVQNANTERNNRPTIWWLWGKTLRTVASRPSNSCGAASALMFRTPCAGRSAARGAVRRTVAVVPLPPTSREFRKRGRATATVRMKNLFIEVDEWC